MTRWSVTMGEGRSPSDAGQEIAGHPAHGSGHSPLHDRVVSIVEAVLLAIVALLAAWSGYASAQWSNESQLLLAQADTARAVASRALLAADAIRDLDSSTFDAWFTAFVAGDLADMDLAERRFRPGFKVAFDAWLATDPAQNPDAVPGPTYMPEYRLRGVARGRTLDAKAEARYAKAVTAGGNADDYVRITLFFATVLFLVGVSGHFPVRAARYALIAVAVAIILFSVVQLVGAPRPPG
jgi:hypothetical protein